MLSFVGNAPAVVACSTCRYAASSRRDPDGRSGGARLAEALRKVKAADDRYDGIAVYEMPCLFACNDHCAVHIRAPGKFSYILGRFVADEGAARAILDYAVRYAESELGQVPYAQWPNGVKGHFITRSPPEGFVGE